MELAACQADYSLAYLDFLNGHYSDSLNAFANAGECFRQLGDRRCLALTELDQSEINLHLNLYSQAINDALDVAVEFGRLKMSYEQAKAYYFAAAAYFAYGDFSNVTRLANKAHGIFKKENNRIWQVICEFLLAKVDCQEGRVTAALKAFRRIAAVYRNSGDIRRYYDVKLALLEALISSQNLKSAAAVANRISASRQKLAGYQKFIYNMLQGDRFSIQARQQSASKYYHMAIKEAQKLQSAVFPDEIRRFFWMDKLSAYNRLAALYLDTGQERKAYDMLAQKKVASTIVSDDALGRARGKVIPPDLEAERNQLKSYLRKAMMPIGSEARGIASINRIHEAEHRLWKIDRSLRDATHFDRKVKTPTSRNLDEIQQKLDRQGTLIQYVCQDEAFGAFVIGKKKFEYVSFGAGVGEIRGLLARLYFLITKTARSDNDTSIISDLIRSLSIRIWHPLLCRLNESEKLIIIPDGILHRLPYYVLNNGDGSLLFERFEAYLYSSSSTFIGHGAKTALSGKFRTASILISGNDNLPGAAIEGRTISRPLPISNLFMNEEANCSTLYDCLSKKDGLVHLVAHAAQSYENHLFSQILLSDGPVYPFDLISRTVNSRLVVLSGCQTGDPGLFYSGDTVSLAQSFIAAGAKCVIASYWPVSDEVTCLLMDKFYSEVSNGANIYQALKAAMMEMRTVSGDIMHWAPFYLVCR
jgi:CHAT domain-containing protein